MSVCVSVCVYVCVCVCVCTYITFGICKKKIGGPTAMARRPERSPRVSLATAHA